MRRLPSAVMAVVIAILGLVTLAEAVAFIANLRIRKQAEDLLHDVRTLRANVSTTDDVLRIVNRYPHRVNIGATSECFSPDGAPLRSDASYAVLIANNTINHVGLASPFLRRIGIRPSGASADFFLAKGLLCNEGYSLEVLPGPSIQISKAFVTDTASRCNAGEQGVHGCYEIIRDMAHPITQRLGVYISAGATLEQRQHALDFDLSCLTSLQGCQKLCQMMPSVWRDLMAHGREGHDPAEVNDPRCIAIEHSRS